MNLTWQIVKKDLTRLQLPLAGLVLVMVAKIALGLALRAGGGVDFTWFTTVQLYVNLCTVLEALLVYVIVAVLVLEDGITGASVLWRVRPISPARLLRAKALAALLMFGVLPVLVALPWWLSCGFGPAEIGNAIMLLLVGHALVVIPSFGLAVLCDNIGRYFLLTIGLIAVAMFLAIMIVAYFPVVPVSLPIVEESRLKVAVMAVAVVLVGGLAVTVLAFFLRRTAVGYAVWLASIVVAVVVLYRWPSAHSERTPAARDDILAPSNLTATLRRNELFLGRPKAAEGNLQLVLTSMLRLEYVPSDLAVKPVGVSVAWTAVDGTRRASDGFYSSQSFNLGDVDKIIRTEMPELAKAVPDSETQHWINVEWPLFVRKIGGTVIPPEKRRAELSLDVRFNLRRADAERLLAPDAGPTETAEFVTAKPEVIWRNSLTESERRTHRALGVRIAHAKPVSSEGFKAVDLAMVETSSSRSAALTAHFLGYGTPILFSPVYYTANRSLGTIAGVGRESVIAVDVSGVQVTWRKFSVHEPAVRRGDRFVSWGHPDWDRSLMLFLIGYREEGRFTRTVGITGIKTGPSGDEPFHN